MWVTSEGIPTVEVTHFGKDLDVSVFCLSLFLFLSLFTTIAFYIACHDRIYYFYPSTTFGSL